MKKRQINGHSFIAYQPGILDENTMKEESMLFLSKIKTRRSVRYFSKKDVPLEVINNIIETASSAPSGANKQPWVFCVVKNTTIKKKIRQAAEKEEYASYHNRMNEDWLNDLRPLGTNWEKPFLEEAPYLIVVFKKVYESGPDGNKKNNYYVNESVGLACGFLIAAIHMSGLAALTHTPSPMNFLTEILERPENERPFLLIPVGYPSEDCYVPDIERKKLDEVVKHY